MQKALTCFIGEVNANDFVLVISGDITFQGSKDGFTEAGEFFNQIINDNGIDRRRILACPGNHDIIQNEKPRFELFNSFLYSLRKNQDLDFRNKNFTSYMLDEVFFLLINSAYHLNYDYGLVDEEIYAYIENNKSRIDECKHRIAITHHHMLNQFENDTSAIRNSYPFLYALDLARFDLILHGHQHTIQSMPIGNSRMSISAPRSFNFSEQGYPNGINHYFLNTNGKFEKEEYQFSKDKTPTKVRLVKL